MRDVAASGAVVSMFLLWRERRIEPGDVPVVFLVGTADTRAPVAVER